MEIFFLPNPNESGMPENCLVDVMSDNEMYGHAVDPAKIDYNIKLLSRLTGRPLTEHDEPFAVGRFIVVFGKTGRGMLNMEFFSHAVPDGEHMNAIFRTIYEHVPEDDFYAFVKARKEQLKTYDPALHDIVDIARVGYA